VGTVRDIREEPSIRQVSINRVQRVAIGPATRSALLAGGAALLLIGALAWPLFSNTAFSPDWIEQLWFVSLQGAAIRANHLPTLFIHYPGGVFYALFAFYGGTLYALTGLVSLLLGGSAISAYILAYLLGFAAAYGGWYWIARSFGLGHWSAQVPGALFITSSYYLTLIYSRGDWPEFTAVSMIPLVIASGLSVLRADRLRIGPALALVASSIVFFGSHNLTMVWGSTAIALVGLLVLACVPQARRRITRRSALRVLGLVVPAVLVNAWFLFPTIAYESTTYIANAYTYWRVLLRGTMSLVAAGNLFTFSRASVSNPGTAFSVSLPILAMAWALVSLVVFARRALREIWARVMLICAGFTVLMALLMTHAGLILVLPRAYSTLQFSYRLESYVLLGLSGTILAILVLTRNGDRRLRLWSWALVPILSVSVVGAVQQAAAYPKGGEGRSQSLAGETRQPTGVPPGVTPAEAPRPDYTDTQLRRLADPYGRPAEVYFAPAAVHDNRISKVVRLPPGQLVYTNLQGPPYLVHVSGAKIVGINPGYYDVLEIGRGKRIAQRAGARRKDATFIDTISVSPASSVPVVLGRYVSLAAVIALVTGFLVFAIRRRRGLRT
jgi:hypothetical protein